MFNIYSIYDIKTCSIVNDGEMKIYCISSEQVLTTSITLVDELGFYKNKSGQLLAIEFGRNGTFYEPNKPLLYYIWSQMHFKNCPQPHSCHLWEQDPNNIV